MALVIKNRVKTTTTSTTSPFTLGSAASGYQAGSVIGDGNTSIWLIVGATPTEWEIMVGTYATSGPTLTRVTTLESSTGSAVTFSAGTQTVSVIADARAIGNIAAFGMSETSVTTTATAAVGTMHVCSGTTSDYTVTLPAASGNAGRLIGFRMDSGLTKLVTIDGNASETIDGSLTRIMWAGETAILLCDGSNWFKVAGKTIPMAVTVKRTTDSSFSVATWSACPMSTYQDGFQSMHDSGNNRVKILRPGRYFAACYLYTNGTSGGTYSYLGPAVNSTDASGHFSQSGVTTSNSAGGFGFTFDCAINDYINACAYTDTTSPKFLGIAINTLNVVEVPTW